MHHTGGSIVNLSSVHAFTGMSGHSIYAATKGAIVALTRQLAIELAPFKIRVNAIAPGWIETENQHKVMEFTDDAEGSKIPAGRLGQPIDVAHLAAFLAAPDCYINGQTIILDGGLTAPLIVSDAWRQASDAPFGRPYVPGI